MINEELINGLSIIILLGFLVALFYLILLLYRANKVLAKLDHLGETFRSFVSDIVPAIVNVGTIATALEAILRSLHQPNPVSKLPSAKRQAKGR